MFILSVMLSLLQVASCQESSWQVHQNDPIKLDSEVGAVCSEGSSGAESVITDDLPERSSDRLRISSVDLNDVGEGSQVDPESREAPDSQTNSPIFSTLRALINDYVTWEMLAMFSYFIVVFFCGTIAISAICAGAAATVVGLGLCVCVCSPVILAAVVCCCVIHGFITNFH